MVLDSILDQDTMVIIQGTSTTKAMVALMALQAITREVQHGEIGMAILVKNHTSSLSVKFATKRGVLHPVVITGMSNYLLLIQQSLSAKSVENVDTLP